HVFYRKLGRSYPRIVRGEGCWLYDEQGKGYLDAVGGAYVANLGHSNPEIAEALARQAREFGYVSGTAFTHGPVEELARELAATPGLQRRAARARDRARGRRHGRRVQRGAGRRLVYRGVHAAPRVLPDDPRDLRSARRALRGRRDLVRGGPDRQLVGDRAVWR